MTQSNAATADSLPVIIVEPIEHYGVWKTGIFFKKDFKIQKMTRQVADVRFSKSCSGWVVIPWPSLVDELRKAVHDHAVVIDELGNPPSWLVNVDIECPADYIDLLTRKRYSGATIRITVRSLFPFYGTTRTRLLMRSVRRRSGHTCST
ncbi:MAG TPA: hypothetical protein VD927_07230 [Chryseosolibacter sp.]|nr:hypothetical protein [Chryseosolibacter sp.]